MEGRCEAPPLDPTAACRVHRRGLVQPDHRTQPGQSHRGVRQPMHGRPRSTCVSRARGLGGRRVHDRHRRRSRGPSSRRAAGDHQPLLLDREPRVRPHPLRRRRPRSHRGVHPGPGRARRGRQPAAPTRSHPRARRARRPPLRLQRHRRGPPRSTRRHQLPDHLHRGAADHGATCAGHRRRRAGVPRRRHEGPRRGVRRRGDEAPRLAHQGRRPPPRQPSGGAVRGRGAGRQRRLRRVRPPPADRSGPRGSDRGRHAVREEADPGDEPQRHHHPRRRGPRLRRRRPGRRR